MRLSWKSVPLAALVLALLLALPASLPADTARAGQPLWVLPDTAALRAERSGLSPALARLPRGTRVELVRAEGAWALVRQDQGRTAWIYLGHLGAEPPPALADEPLPTPAHTFSLAEAADTARSSRSAPVDQGQAQSQAPAQGHPPDILGMPVPSEQLEEFLREGGIGEYAPLSDDRPVQGGQARHEPNQCEPGKAALARGAQAMPKAMLPHGGEAETQLGANVAALALRTLTPRTPARPALGSNIQRYVGLTGLAVARYAPGEPRNFRCAVLENSAPFALGLPGGSVLVSTGLLAALDNEAQLALILARETARASLGQSWALARQTVFFSQRAPDNRAPANRAELESQAYGQAVEQVLRGLLSGERNPSAERDLDAAAMQMALRAGYDPQQLLPALERIAQKLRQLATAGKAPVQAPPALTLRRAIAVHQTLSRLPLNTGMALATERYRANR